MIEASAKKVAPPALFRPKFATTWIPGENSATAPTWIKLGARSSATIAQTASYTFREKLNLNAQPAFSNKASQAGATFANLMSFLK